MAGPSGRPTCQAVPTGRWSQVSTTGAPLISEATDQDKTIDSMRCTEKNIVYLPRGLVSVYNDNSMVDTVMNNLRLARHVALTKRWPRASTRGQLPSPRLILTGAKVDRNPSTIVCGHTSLVNAQSQAEGGVYRLRPCWTRPALGDFARNRRWLNIDPRRKPLLQAEVL